MTRTNTVRLPELPCLDGHKSFCGKAVTWSSENGTIWLRSYETVVCCIDASGVFHRLWDGYSATTMRHVNSFLKLNGLSGGGKAWWNNLEVEAV